MKTLLNALVELVEDGTLEVTLTLPPGRIANKVVLWDNALGVPIGEYKQTLAHRKRPRRQK